MDHNGGDDPLSQFFPGDDDVDLYKVIGVNNSASQEDIRKAYRRLALLHHPDKHAQASDEARAAASVKFQQLGFAYAVLSDEKRRRRYDSTGSTEDTLPVEEGADGWDAYFKDLFDKVTKARLDEDKKQYQGSPEELQDLQAAYLATEGSIDGIFERIPHSNYTDENRFVKLLNDSIKRKEIPDLDSWKKEVKDKRARARRRKEGEKEAQAAEEAAKELGVWDDLYKDRSKESATGEDEHSALKALIQGKKRKTDDFLDGLVAKYAKEEKPSGGGRKKSRKT